MKDFYTNHKELVDQSAHVGYCAILAIICMVGRLHIWAIPIGFLIPYCYAITREWYQHSRLVLFNKDVGFSCTGALVGIIISFLIGV